MPSIPAGAFNYYGLRLMVPVSNFMMVFSGIMLLVKARELQALPPGSLIQGDGSADKLASCGILGIHIGLLQSALVIGYLWVVRTFAEQNPTFKLATKVTSAVQGVLIALALIYMIIPGVDGGPESYTEIRGVGFASTVYIVFYAYVLIGLVKSVWLKEGSMPIIATNTPGAPPKGQYGGFNTVA